MNSDVQVSNSGSSRAGNDGMQAAAQGDVLRAQADYERLRTAYLAIAQTEHDNEVALAMIGADMERAHATLQRWTGLCRLPLTQETPTVWRGEGGALAEATT